MDEDTARKYPPLDSTEQAAALLEANQQLVLATMRAQTAEQELREAARHAVQSLGLHRQHLGGGARHDALEGGHALGKARALGHGGRGQQGDSNGRSQWSTGQQATDGFNGFHCCGSSSGQDIRGEGKTRAVRGMLLVPGDGSRLA